MEVHKIVIFLLESSISEVSLYASPSIGSCSEVSCTIEKGGSLSKYKAVQSVLCSFQAHTSIAALGKITYTELEDIL